VTVVCAGIGSGAPWWLLSAIPLLGLAYVGALFFDAEWNAVELGKQFEPEIWKGLFVISLATLVLNSIAIAASTRLGQVLTLVIVIGVFVLIAACAVWLAERHRNPHFDRGVTKGVGASLWWSVVTLATVGYGDKVPQTVLGRLLAAAWMLVSLVLLTVLTATIVSAITVGSLSTRAIHSASGVSLTGPIASTTTHPASVRCRIPQWEKGDSVAPSMASMSGLCGSD
jgi:voltage-gated potassium channel Kch